MFNKNLEEEHAVDVDERLATVVRIIVEQYHGDVEAFIESIRYRVEVNRRTHFEADHGDDAAVHHFEA
jgi:hypothetical protein